MMVKIKAKVKLYVGIRRTAFCSGYRPHFNFIDEMKVSGHIHLLDRDAFLPGDEGLVNISFLSSDYLGDDFDVGKKFYFSEGPIIVGEGIVEEILSDLS